MATKNTATTKATATKAKATDSKSVATPKKEKPVATPKNKVTEKVEPTITVFGKPVPANPYNGELLEELDSRTNAIKDNIGKIDKSFFDIAFNLYWMTVTMAYKARGYDSIVKYASVQFGYEKTTCYSLIAIVERFAKRDKEGRILEEINPLYKDFSSSKLSLMVGLTDEQITSNFSPKSSVREIKKYVKSLKDRESDQEIDFNALDKLISSKSGTECSGNNVEETENVADSTALEVFNQTLFTCNGFDEYNAKLDKIDETIHKVYKGMPDVSIKVIVERNGKPILGKWGE